LRFSLAGQAYAIFIASELFAFERPLSFAGIFAADLAADAIFRQPLTHFA
jgi:hypothetical protein